MCNIRMFEQFTEMQRIQCFKLASFIRPKNDSSKNENRIYCNNSFIRIIIIITIINGVT